ncbi:unnamed protein product [Cylindrotheca closterium]|uniref:Uncharacterized protein n=1 Tax=Cylindrotheca closterium TaxID=2856 RepID=A0AAD2G2L1_9STRA|nr:unnamed protein product [Cylindrotheca closterium]
MKTVFVPSARTRPMKTIVLALSMMQMLASTVQGESLGLVEQPFGHPYIHQHGHHTENHPAQPDGNQHDHGHHHRHSKKRGSKKSGKRYHPWNGNHLHSIHGKHGKRQGPDKNHHYEHSDLQKNDNNHDSDSHTILSAESFDTNPLHSPMSESSVSSTNSSSLSSSSSSSSSNAKNEQAYDKGADTTLSTTSKNTDKALSMSDMKVETLKISQAKTLLQTRIETETSKYHPDSIEINVISLHDEKHGG